MLREKLGARLSPHGVVRCEQEERFLFPRLPLHGDLRPVRLRKIAVDCARRPKEGPKEARLCARTA